MVTATKIHPPPLPSPRPWVMGEYRTWRLNSAPRNLEQYRRRENLHLYNKASSPFIIHDLCILRILSITESIRGCSIIFRGFYARIRFCLWSRIARRSSQTYNSRLPFARIDLVGDLEQLEYHYRPMTPGEEVIMRIMRSISASGYDWEIWRFPDTEVLCQTRKTWCVISSRTSWSWVRRRCSL